MNDNLFWGFSRRSATRTEVLSQVGPGWSDIINRLLNDLPTLGWDGVVMQVKEKYGTLRFYVGSAPDAVFNRISQAEQESCYTCECCGAPGRTRDGSWLRTLCDICEEKRHTKT